MHSRPSLIAHDIAQAPFSSFVLFLSCFVILAVICHHYHDVFRHCVFATLDSDSSSHLTCAVPSPSLAALAVAC